MGSQFWFVARRKSMDRGRQRKAPSEDAQSSAHYLREMTPFYAVNYATSVSRLSFLDTETRFREGVEEAMHFYNESQMR